jgi:LCP family protein required for cell wall assembly
MFMRIPQWLVLTWVVVIGFLAVGTSFAAYRFARDRSAELDEVLDLPDPPQIQSIFSEDQATETPVPPTAVSNAPGVVEATAAVVEEGTPVAAEGETASLENATWDDPRRVTMLLLGIDQRQGETGPFPTDTIILVSLDPVGKTAAILSIPRDLWVNFPGVSQPGRINTANIIGEQLNYPGGGGPAFAAKTVERTIGVPIDYYMVINFEVFIQVIDTVGPIEVCPPEPIDDNEYPDGSYGIISIHFDAGCQELDSERLLQYARTRHGDSDIDRASRQQEVMLAARKKVLSTGGVVALVPEAPALWESMQENINTNISLEELIRLARTAEGIDSENIRQGQITFAEVTTSTTPEGDEILLPIATDIRILIDDLFRPAGAPSTRQ